jgi:hypothetical protein
MLESSVARFKRRVQGFGSGASVLLHSFTQDERKERRLGECSAMTPERGDLFRATGSGI